MNLKQLKNKEKEMIDKFKPLYRVKDVAYALKISEQYVYQVLKKAGRSPVKTG